VGTIGGGLLEARVLAAAKKVFSARAPMRLSLNLMGKDVAETDMICGGDVDIFLEPLSAEDQIRFRVSEKSWTFRSGAAQASRNGGHHGPVAEG